MKIKGKRTQLIMILETILMAIFAATDFLDEEVEMAIVTILLFVAGYFFAEKFKSNATE